MIILTKFIPPGFDAITLWPLILICPLKSTPGLITHEMTHYRVQAWITPIWLLLYCLSPTFRLAAQVSGYKAQIASGDITRDGADHMFTLYGLGMTKAEALQALA